MSLNDIDWRPHGCIARMQDWGDSGVDCDTSESHASDQSSGEDEPLPRPATSRKRLAKISKPDVVSSGAERKYVPCWKERETETVQRCPELPSSIMIRLVMQYYYRKQLSELLSCNRLIWWGSTCSSFEAPCVRTQWHSVCSLLGLGLSSSVQLAGDLPKMWQWNHEGKAFSDILRHIQSSPRFSHFDSSSNRLSLKLLKTSISSEPEGPELIKPQQTWSSAALSTYIPSQIPLFSTILMWFVCVLLTATTNAAMFAAWQSVLPSLTGLQSPHRQLWKVPVPSLTGLLVTQASQIWEQGQQGQPWTFRTRWTRWSFQRKELSSETTISRQVGRATCKRSQERAKERNKIPAFFQICFTRLGRVSMLTCFHM